MKNSRILIVDDEQALVNMLQEFLSAFGAQVDSYTCPLKALQAFTRESDNFDLVITDHSMPGMTGMDLAGKMLKIKPELPIILCTGYSEKANAGSAGKIGVSAFFNKPVKMTELILKITNLLQKNTA